MSQIALKKFITQISIEAGEVLLKYFGKIHQIKHKKNAGIVTEADKAAEKIVLKRIFKAYPSSSVLTEESGSFSGTDELLWILDPLDGTTNYAHGFPWFSVSLALYVNGQPQLGVVYQPFTRELYFAEKTKGASLNGNPIKVSKVAKLKDSLLGTGFYYSRFKRLEEELKVFHLISNRSQGIRRPGSAALDLACVASGRFDGYWERGLSPWDVAAGFLLVEEAGGKLTNYLGKPTHAFAKQVIASNGLVHSAMGKIVRNLEGREFEP